MILDQPEQFERLDPAGMLGEIDALPGQLQAAWELGQSLELAASGEIQQVVIAGMGGSAIGADLLAAYAAPLARLPILIWRNYGLPGYVSDNTLVITSSHSGNTEETLSAFDRAIGAGAQVLAITTGGELARRAEAASVPLWRFEHAGQPRAAVGYSFGLLAAALHKLGYLAEIGDEIQQAVEAMQRQQSAIEAQVPVAGNLAKRIGGQFMDRWPTIVGAEFLAPVARRWRTQIAELAKAVAQFEVLPEADHNMIAGVEYPPALFGPTMVLFLVSSQLNPRNIKRIEATRSVMMLEGFNTDVLEAQGRTRLAHQWTSLHFGDYVAYYLAMAYGADPTPVAAIEDLKQRLVQG